MLNFVSIAVTIIVIAALAVGGYFTYKKITTAETLVATDTTANTLATGGNANTPPPSLTGAAAISLGKYPIAPWGSTSNFVDPQAQWIWNLSTAATEAPANIPIKFSTLYTNSSGSPIDAVLHVLVDDNATVYLNGTKVGVVGGGWNSPDYTKLPISLPIGYNTIDIVATNAGGPAALIASLVKTSDKSVLLRTDNTWLTNAG